MRKIINKMVNYQDEINYKQYVYTSYVLLTVIGMYFVRMTIDNKLLNATVLLFSVLIMTTLTYNQIKNYLIKFGGFTSNVKFIFKHIVTVIILYFLFTYPLLMIEEFLVGEPEVKPNATTFKVYFESLYLFGMKVIWISLITTISYSMLMPLISTRNRITKFILSSFLLFVINTTIMMISTNESIFAVIPFSSITLVTIIYINYYRNILPVFISIILLINLLLIDTLDIMKDTFKNIHIGETLYFLILSLSLFYLFLHIIQKASHKNNIHKDFLLKDNLLTGRYIFLFVVIGTLYEFLRIYSEGLLERFVGLVFFITMIILLFKTPHSFLPFFQNNLSKGKLFKITTYTFLANFVISFFMFGIEKGFVFDRKKVSLYTLIDEINHNFYVAFNEDVFNIIVLVVLLSTFNLIKIPWKLNVVISVLGTATLFGLSHIPAQGLTPSLIHIVPYIIVIAVVLKYKNVYIAIIGHIIYNTVWHTFGIYVFNGVLLGGFISISLIIITIFILFFYLVKIIFFLIKKSFK